MNDSEYDLMEREYDKKTALVECNRPENGIEVIAEVTFGNVEHCEQIKIEIAPNIATLLPQVQNLMKRIHACARGMMLRAIADKFLKIGASGVSPEYKYEPLRAHAIISVPGGSVAIVSGVEVIFLVKDIAESVIFEYEELEQAKERLILQLLADFAALGGQ